jgi:hypothetical protein
MSSDTVILFHDGELGPAELNVMKIAEFMGFEIRHERCLPTGGRVITNAENLSRLLESVRQSGADVFVYGFEPTAHHSQVLQNLTGGGILGVETQEGSNQKYRVGTDSRALCRQFAALDFESCSVQTDRVFIAARDCAPDIELGQAPFFLRCESRGCQLFLSACPEIADLDAAVVRDAPILKFFPSLVPLMMFLGLGGGGWRSDAPRACFILDDPLLRERYGFLDYEKLLAMMKQTGFCTSIAFIPWNYQRTDRRVAALCATNPDRYSLCVHGCDHTSGEFGVNDERLLRQKAQTALERMGMHQKTSGVGFDDVMVFPQGVFSTNAMKELKDCGYLAAINSTPYPVDAGVRLTLRDLLEVAVTRFASFPLFIRRYPRRLVELAFDLFVGKPALIVEHHGFFRDGYQALAETIEKLHGVEKQLQWANLNLICSRACRKRAAEDGVVEVEFYTDRFTLRNDTGQPQRYKLVRRDSRAGFEEQLTLGPGRVAEIRTSRGHVEPVKETAGQKPIYRLGVFIRRSLSEFRDNYLETNSLLKRPSHNRLDSR